MIERTVKVLVLTNLLSILAGTLFPFNFSLPEGLSLQEIFRGFYYVSNPLDFIVNILLFISFGFFCSWLLRLKGLKKIRLIVAALGISVGVSTTIEVLQLFLSQRFSTKSDIFANCLGGFFGYLSFLVFCWCLSVSPTRLRKIFQPKYLFLSLTTYLTITICITISLSNSISLKNWDTGFPLVLGNEATGNRPWLGSIAQLSIFDRALSVEDVQQFLLAGNTASNSKSSLLADYLISGLGNYQDRTSQLPVLTWQGQSSFEGEKNQATENVYLTRDRWLTTSNAPGLLVEKIRQTSQFTVCTVIATSELIQSGPARIISLSGDPYNRNFTLAQEGNNLVFRLRTPLMGRNGSKFNLLIPNIFTDTDYHRLAISYDNSTVKIYLDDLSKLYSWQLMPEAAFFEQLFPNSFNYEGMLDYKILFYLIVFVPLGLLLALLSLVLSRRSVYRYMFFSVGITLSAGIFQALLANNSKTNLDLANFLLSTSIATTTLFLVRAVIFVRASSAFRPA